MVADSVFSGVGEGLVTMGIRGSLLSMFELAADADAFGLLKDWFGRVT